MNKTSGYPEEEREYQKTPHYHPTKSFYRTIVTLYPHAFQKQFFADVERLAFHAKLVFCPEATLLDLGSGLSPLALGLQKLGMKTIMVDRFDYPADLNIIKDPQFVFKILEENGVTLHQLNIEHFPLPLSDATVDVIISIGLIEDLHKSPRSLFSEIVRVLKPGGKLLFGGPNAVNLRKRISVLFGRTNYPPIKQFWENGDPNWFGHVREPTVNDLVWIARTAGFRVLKVLGRNFIAKQNFSIMGRVGDAPLRLFPGLCSDIYVLANKEHNDGI